MFVLHVQVCKSVGVLDIDLFVASDVVEKTGDLRMLVLCIRALSRRCKALDLAVSFCQPMHSFFCFISIGGPLCSASSVWGWALRSGSRF